MLKKIDTERQQYFHFLDGPLNKFSKLTIPPNNPPPKRCIESFIKVEEGWLNKRHIYGNNEFLIWIK